MKILNIIIISIFVFFACNTTKKTSQVVNPIQQEKLKEFEGKIIYDLKFQDKTGEMSPEQVKMLFGEEQIYTMKGHQYKNEMNGMMKITQIYLGGDTLFNHVGGMTDLFWIDATTNPDQFIDFNIQKEVETIAGIKCDLLTINSKEGVTKFYFNKNYYVNPALFKNHEYGFWKFSIEKTNSIPIKSITDTKDQYIEITTKEIKEMKIDDAEFLLPNLPRVESPEN